MVALHVVLLLAGAVPGATEIEVRAPDGWTDTTGEAPRPEPGSDELHLVSAILPSAADQGFAPTFAATRVDAILEIEPERLASLADRLRGGGLDVLSAEIVPVAGVRAYRIVFEGREDGVVYRSVAWSIPSGRAFVNVTYTASLARFDAYRPDAETALARIRGAREPSWLEAFPWNDDRVMFPIVAISIGAVVAASYARRARAARRAEALPRNPLVR
jgi:hypothetical protein